MFLSHFNSFLCFQGHKPSKHSTILLLAFRQTRHNLCKCLLLQLVCLQEPLVPCKLESSQQKNG